jgi:hypothetical protein
MPSQFLPARLYCWVGTAPVGREGLSGPFHSPVTRHELRPSRPILIATYRSRHRSQHRGCQVAPLQRHTHCPASRSSSARFSPPVSLVRLPINQQIADAAHAGKRCAAVGVQAAVVFSQSKRGFGPPASTIIGHLPQWRARIRPATGPIHRLESCRRHWLYWPRARRR